MEFPIATKGGKEAIRCFSRRVIAKKRSRAIIRWRGASDAERMFDRAQLLERSEEPRRSLSALALGMTVTSFLNRLVCQRTPLSKEV
jgi:phosphoheptose isomerase